MLYFWGERQIIKIINSKLKKVLEEGIQSPTGEMLFVMSW